jgi:cytochrome c5
MPEGEHRLLFTEDQIRNAFVLTGVGMVGLLVLLLVLATSKPQGRPQAADDSQYQATLLAAAENLDGFELIGEDRARIDVRHAMQLVAERGTALEIVPIGAVTQPVNDVAETVAATVDGRATYEANCSGCHQASGAGIPGVFPMLGGGHAANLASEEGGRTYLVNALLYGVQGERAHPLRTEREPRVQRPRGDRAPRSAMPARR